MKKVLLKESPYSLREGVILQAEKMTNTEKYFKISLKGGERLQHQPGQFVMVSLAGVGDIPLSISSSPTSGDFFELVVRKAGRVTTALHNCAVGSSVGIRGPFGKGFPVDLLEGKDLLFIAGGLGIVPSRSLINFVIDNRSKFGKVTILIGFKTPKDILFAEEVEVWKGRIDINFNCTVDKPDSSWRGNTGVITSLISSVEFDTAGTFAIVVGPPIMYKFVILKLLTKGMSARQVIVSLERRMKCGVGKCGHCQIAQYYCCKDGPVFSYDKIKDIGAV